MKQKAGFLALLTGLILVSFACGRYPLSLSQMIEALFHQGDAMIQSVIWNIRMPRILLVCICGGALALSGIIYQTIFKNPLASGDVIGASSGCSLGAVIAILFSQNTYLIELSAFITGLATVLFTIYLAGKVKGNRILNLVIAGLIMQAMMTSALMVLKNQCRSYA